MKNMTCSECGKPMHKSGLRYRTEPRFYQWVCDGFPRCNHREYEDHQGQIITDPKSNKSLNYARTGNRKRR